MAEDVGVFKSLFTLEALVGTSTVSLTTLKQSSWKTIYGCLWILVYSYELATILIRLYLDRKSRTYVNIFLTPFWYCIIIYLMFQALMDHKTQVSAVLNLQSAQKRLEVAEIKIVPISAFYLLTVGLVTGIKLLTPLCNIKLVVYTSHSVSITNRLTLYNHSALQIAKFLAFVFFSLKIIQTQQSIKKALDNINVLNRVNSEYDNRNIMGRQGLNLECVRILDLIRDLRGAVDNSEVEVSDYNFSYLLGTLIDLAVVVPNTLYVNEKAGLESYLYIMFNILLLIQVLYCLCLIHVQVSCVKERLSSVLNLSVLSMCFMNTKHRKKSRHQVMACLHCSNKDPCWMFNLEYSLLLTVLETAVLVFTGLAAKA